LLEGNKINPENNVSKEEFLIMAYTALKYSSCIDDDKNALALKIDILNKECKT
jgi:hypothetical protein